MPVLPWSMLGGHTPGAPIYAHLDLLSQFATRKLPWIRAPFTLVSGDGDVSVPGIDVSPETVQKILSHPSLKAWYVQNLVAEDPKLHPLPIGLDYHTLSVGRLSRWGAQARPVDQEAELDRIRLAADTADPRAFCNWHLNVTHPYRRALAQGLSSDVAFLQPDLLARAESWALNAQFRFTVSPRGQGLDCHRTWEALALGSIPVVESGPLDRLYTGLPVLVVSRLSDVTAQDLATAWDEMRTAMFDFAPLFLDYWRDCFNGCAPGRLELSWSQFRATPLPKLAAAYRAPQ